jgi:hypothetical protein
MLITAHGPATRFSHGQGPGLTGLLLPLPTLQVSLTPPRLGLEAGGFGLPLGRLALLGLALLMTLGFGLAIHAASPSYSFKHRERLAPIFNKVKFGDAALDRGYTPDRADFYV